MRKRLILFSVYVLLGAGFLVLGAGCVTYSDTRTRQVVHEREDIMLLREDIRRLSGRLEGMEMEVERMQREVANLRSEQAGMSRTFTQDTAAKLDIMERRIREVDQARENDKKEIVERLSGAIEQLMRSQAATGGSSRAAPGGYGYEHTVGPGETLSQIAAAYGVRARVIIEANNISNPDRLQVGQKLFIPE